MSILNEIEKQENIGAACFRCRGFRHACDRQKPTCSRCQRRGIDCVYPEAAPTLKKLKKATDNLDDRIKRFNNRLKANDPCFFLDYKDKVASTANFSVYPCTKCFKDLQQCDLRLPQCTRCEANQFECRYRETEPKANHVSQAVTAMNKVMDQWQDAIDRMTNKWSLKNKAAFKITATKKGLSVESNVRSYHDLSIFVDQFKHAMFFSETMHKKEPFLAFDDTQTSRFVVWQLWTHSTLALPKNYPLDITQELTDNLVHLYCRTPCCSSIRIPILNTSEFLARYRSPAKRPPKVLIYAVCAMAARNAFQLHVWSKRPSGDCPQYNMGKALSVAYCLRGRELLSDCFDKPSLDHCQAAFLLSYCHYQNGYPGVIYFYEWIAYTMATEMGLYEPQRVLTSEEKMLIWCLYYFNVWYRVLQGADGVNGSGVSQCKPPIETMPQAIDRAYEIDHYVWNAWVYMLQMQVIRDQWMAVLSNERQETQVEQVWKMQQKLTDFYHSLPSPWRSYSTEEPSTNHKIDEPYTVDVSCFAAYCVQRVQVEYDITRILLYEPFVPLYRVPSTAFSMSSLETVLEAANRIHDVIDKMSKRREVCLIPIVAFLFVNAVYKKLVTYQDRFKLIGRQGLLRTLTIAKSCIAYIYDFELTRPLVHIMELDIESSVQHIPSSVF